MILDITRSDLWLPVLHMQRGAAESPVYKDMTINSMYSLQYLEAMWDTGALFGAVSNDSTGCMIGVCTANWTSPTLQASELMLYVEPQARGTGLAIKLVQRFTEIARQRGAQKLYVGSSTGINDEGVRKLYERLGFKSIGSALSKEL